MEKFIGCSGFYYNHWIGLFYPESLPKKNWLEYYSERFNTVEINNTFYKMPVEKTVKNWYEITPVNFVFAVKGYRYFTHLKKFNTDGEFKRNLDSFQKIAGSLREKCGPLLWQLPVNFPANTEKLKNFCSLLSKEFRHVFEFRNESWFNVEVYDILKSHNHALCIVSSPSKINGIVKKTSDFEYIRFHGEGSWYRDNYSDETLQSWKNKLEKTNAKTLYVYFNNDANAYAINNARFLQTLFH